MMNKSKIIGLFVLGLSSVSFSENERAVNDSLPSLSKEEFKIKMAPLVLQKKEIHDKLEVKLSELDDMIENNFVPIIKDLIDDCEDQYEDLEISEFVYTKRRTQLEIILSKAKSYSKLTYSLNNEYKKKFRPFQDMDKLEKRRYRHAQRMKRYEKVNETSEKSGEEQKK